MRKNQKLTEEQRIDAREAFALLDGRGLSLTDCVRGFLALGGQATRVSNSLPLVDAVDAFMLSRFKKKLREASIQWYRVNLDLFADKFSGKRMDDVDSAAIRAWLKPLSHHSADGRLRTVRAMYRYGLTQVPAWCSADATIGITVEKPLAGGSIEFLTVEQCRTILETAPANHRHALALMLFAGIRPDEIRGQGKPPLDWRHIDRKEKTIHIPAEIVKMRDQPRLLQHKLPANLWKWLKDAPESGAISNVSRTHVQVRAKESLGGDKWPHDAMRHTFATYHVAAFGDIAATAELLGHGESLTMLKRHYQGVAKKSEGEAFFAIMP